METKNSGENKGLATPTYTFKYVESSFIDGREMSNIEKTWTAENLDDYNRFRDIWQELEVSDGHYWLTEVGSLIEDGYVCMALDYTFDLTELGSTVKYIRGISYKIAA